MAKYALVGVVLPAGITVSQCNRARFAQKNTAKDDDRSTRLRPVIRRDVLRQRNDFWSLKYTNSSVSG